LQGIYDFDEESSTQYKNGRGRAAEFFGQVADVGKIYHGKPPLSKLESL